MGSKKRKIKRFRAKSNKPKKPSNINYLNKEERSLIDSIHSTIEFGSNTVTKYVLNPFTSAACYMYNCAINGSQRVCYLKY